MPKAFAESRKPSRGHYHNIAAIGTHLFQLTHHLREIILVKMGEDAPNSLKVYIF